MSSAEKYVYQFGPFSLDPSERTLTRENTFISLRPKAFDLLLYVVENAGRLVTDYELLDAVWPGVAVEQSNITLVIHELRKILGKDVEFQRVRGRGYRIVNANIIALSKAHRETPALVRQLTKANSEQFLHPSRLLRVFLCHSSDDKPAVRQLFQRLRSTGTEPWLDEENLLPGQDWQHEIPKAVRSSDVVLVCLSNTSVSKSGYIQKEIRYALDIADEQPEGTIFLIPLKLEQCQMPDRLRRWQWVNLFEESGYQKLVRALQVRANELGLVVESASGSK